MQRSAVIAIAAATFFAGVAFGPLLVPQAQADGGHQGFTKCAVGWTYQYSTTAQFKKDPAGSLEKTSIPVPEGWSIVNISDGRLLFCK